MDIVFFFKNQSDFRLNDTTDLKILKISIRQWNRLYKPGITKTYISGIYTQKEYKDIIDYLGESFIKKYNIQIINIKKIPPEFTTNKSNKVNYSLIITWEYLKKPFIVGTNDIFPIKMIDDSYINKHYKILHNDYTKIPKGKDFWITEHWTNTNNYFKEKYNFANKEIYEGHNAYLITKEFMDFYTADKNLWIDMDRDMVHTVWMKMKGQNVLHEDNYCGVTFEWNKWQLDKKKLQKYKMINLTLPNHPKSKSFISKYLLK